MTIVESKISASYDYLAVCPTEWELLKGSCYLLVKKPLKWSDARNMCEKLRPRSHLVKITSLLENNFVLRLVKRNGPEIRSAVWLGMRIVFRTYRWTDGTRAQFTHWSPGEPNGGGSYLCGQMYGTGLWNDHYCTDVLPYLCEQPVV